MNRNFKVVFSKARGALMVVNEATSSVQAKGTKTVIAAAVAALSLSALAWLRLRSMFPLKSALVLL
ncbi:ESPR-type extended signal peptide-containing protein [Sutterella wadsworthensis]|uniref:ESPR-type extended signal peptide-containing protein n=1 Tax=Sutterella wadsworthensis TaxID=40545 RepID=UPI00307A87D8